MHEIHRPALVDGFRHGQRLGFLTNNALSWLDPQVQFEFAVNAIHPFVIPSVALHVTQVQKAEPKSPVALVVGQANQKVSDFNILC
jgi:hypothetical protein